MCELRPKFLSTISLFFYALAIQVQAVVSKLKHKLTLHARTQARSTHIPKDAHAAKRYLKINKLEAWWTRHLDHCEAFTLKAAKKTGNKSP